MINLYSDYLISSFGKTTATGISELLNGAYSHDQFIRLLSNNFFDSSHLWKLVKSKVRDLETNDGVIIFDDTIQEKRYSKKNELISYHYDHTLGTTIKGINLLNCLYHVNDVSIPVAYHCITKTVKSINPKTKKEQQKSEFSKNHHFRELAHQCCKNQIKFKYVLADSWFSSKENMIFIRHKCNKHFVMALKSNRLVSLTRKDLLDGKSQRIDSLKTIENYPVQCWMSGINFPVLIYCQIFKNKDGSSGKLYMVCSDLECDADKIETIYKKRWKVELFHKTLKQNASMAKLPAHTVCTQSTYTGH
jgi:hypothetical protein